MDVQQGEVTDDADTGREKSPLVDGLAVNDQDRGVPPSASVVGQVMRERLPARGAGGHISPADGLSERSSETPPEQGAAAEHSRALGGLRQVAVRIPRPLYEAVAREVLSGVERPSYGQLVAWTAQDHPGEVRAALNTAMAQPARQPRGRRLAAETVQLTLRVTPAELAEVDRLLEQAGGAEQGVTRTKVVVAILQVAVDQST